MPKISAPYDAVPLADFTSQYSRLFEAAECRTQAELGALLEVSQASISGAKRRQSVPPEWLVTLFKKKQIDPLWIRSGMGSKTMEATNDARAKTPCITPIERRSVEDCTTDELFAEIMRRARTIARYGE